MIVPRWETPHLKPRPATLKRTKPAALSIFHKATLTARRKRMRVTLPALRDDSDPVASLDRG